MSVRIKLLLLLQEKVIANKRSAIKRLENTIYLCRLIFEFTCSAMLEFTFPESFDQGEDFCTEIKKFLCVNVAEICLQNYKTSELGCRLTCTESQMSLYGGQHLGAGRSSVRVPHSNHTVASLITRCCVLGKDT